MKSRFITRSLGIYTEPYKPRAESFNLHLQGLINEPCTSSPKPCPLKPKGNWRGGAWQRTGRTADFRDRGDAADSIPTRRGAFTTAFAAAYPPERATVPRIECTTESEIRSQDLGFEVRNVGCSLKGVRFRVQGLRFGI